MASTNKFGYVGVSKVHESKNWRFTVGVNGKHLYFGGYATAEDAFIARESYLKEHGLLQPVQDLPGEIWVNAHMVSPNVYVSNKGRVKTSQYRHSYKESLYALLNDRNGYLVFKCNKKQYWVHRLVAMLFKENPLNCEMVNHINGDIKDNTVENIEWVTRRENITHGFVKLQNKKTLTGAHYNKKSGRWTAHITIDKETYCLGYCDEEITAHNRYMAVLNYYGIENKYAGL